MNYGSSASPQLYLASRSPRRRELLDQLGVAHESLQLDVKEKVLSGELPEDYVRRLALAKARAGRLAAAAHLPLPVLGADTAVVLGREILGKPRDAADASRMLAQLSGRTHRVLTAVALVTGIEKVLLSDSRVSFRPIKPAEAAAYWASGEPVDKAGGYAIQGKGAVFVDHLEGSFSGVMGLPLFETALLLHDAGIYILKGP